MPKISIIIATHSRPHLLPRAVESAFKAGVDVEVVVVDDASIDETAEVCQNLKGIKYVRVERNQHTAGARNLGILASTAPYIGFLDDDDWRLPQSLDKQIALLDENPECGLVYGKYLLADQAGNVNSDEAFPAQCPEGDLFWRILKKNIFGCATAVFRKECLYKVGLLDPLYTKIDDWDMWIRIAEIYPILALKEPVAVWRTPERDSGQGSSNPAELYELAIKAYQNKWFKLPRVKELSNENLESKKIQLLNSASESILTDLAYNTKGMRARFNKTVAVLKRDPSELIHIKFYKAVLKSYLKGY